MSVDSSANSEVLQTYIGKHHESFEEVEKPIFIVNLEGDILDINARALGEAGIQTPDEMKKYNVLDFMPKTEGRDVFFKAARYALNIHRGKEAKQPEFEVTLPNGARRIVQVATKLVLPPNAQPSMDSLAGVKFEIRDVTDERKAQARAAIAEKLAGPKTLGDVIALLADGALETIIPYDSANLMLIDEEGALMVNKSWNSKSHEIGNSPRESSATSDKWATLQTMKTSQKPLLINDTAASADWNSSGTKKNIRAYLGAPLIVDGVTVGYLNINSYTPDNFTPDDIDDIAIIAKILSSAVNNALLHDELQEQARIDSLTGLPNRRTFYATTDIVDTVERRNGRPSVYFLLDLDDFKGVNDSMGHMEGDGVLKEVAFRLREQLPHKSDIIARVGGEEFKGYSGGIDGEEGLTVALGLCESISGKPIVTKENTIPVTVSVGMVVRPGFYRPVPTMEELDKQVDLALYAAKRAGKNGVGVYYPELDPEHGRPAYQPFVAVFQPRTIRNQPGMFVTVYNVTTMGGLKEAEATRYTIRSLPKGEISIYSKGRLLATGNPQKEWFKDDIKSAVDDIRWFEMYERTIH